MKIFRKGLSCMLLACLITLFSAPLVASADVNTVTIGNQSFTTLSAAVSSITDNTKTTEIVLQGDLAGDGIVVPEDSRLVLDLNGHTYMINGSLVGSAGTETNGFQLLKNSAITIKNGRITSSKAYILIQNYADLTLTDVELSLGRTGTGLYTLSNNFGNVLIDGNSSIRATEGNAAFDLWYGMSAVYDDGVKVTVETTGAIVGKIEYGKASRADATAFHERTALTIKKGDLSQAHLQVGNEGAVVTSSVALESNCAVKINDRYCLTVAEAQALNTSCGDTLTDLQTGEELPNAHSHRFGAWKKQERTLKRQCGVCQKVEEKNIPTYESSAPVVITATGTTTATISGDVMKGATLVVEDVTETTTVPQEGVLLGAYRFALSLDGSALQPNGTVKVTLPVSLKTDFRAPVYEAIALNDEGEQDGAVIPVVVNDDGTVTFSAEHFSTYAIIAKEGTSPLTWLWVSLGVVLFLLVLWWFSGFLSRKNAVKKAEEQNAPRQTEL